MKTCIQGSQVEILEQKNFLKEYIRRWGNPMSGALLDPIYDIFQTPTIEGFIGYRMAAGCAVVFGDPVCGPENLSGLTEAFESYCRERKLAIVYLVVSESFARWALGKHAHILLEYGDWHLIDPTNFDNKGSKGRLLRHKEHRAVSEGIHAHEYIAGNPAFEEEAKKLEKAWLDMRSGPQVYISHLPLFATSLDNRWFYAEKEGKIIGILLLSRVESHQGWQVYQSMGLPGAPMGTTEYLLLAAYETLKQEGCHYFMLATTAAQSLNEIKGVGPIGTWLIRLVYRMASWIFSLDKKRKYWEKFHAQQERSYILFGRSHIGIKEIRALMKALNMHF